VANFPGFARFPVRGCMMLARMMLRRYAKSGSITIFRSPVCRLALYRAIY
jgi:hypothetical protein